MKLWDSWMIDELCEEGSICCYDETEWEREWSLNKDRMREETNMSLLVGQLFELVSWF